jgi:hypothetical protein
MDITERDTVRELTCTAPIPAPHVPSDTQSSALNLFAPCRYFATWKHKGLLEEHGLPADVAEITGQQVVSFGDGVLRLNDGLLASETCEELFTPQ